MKVGIVGNGRMGEDIFYHLTDFDFSLVWVFRNQEYRDKAAEKFSKRLKRLHKAGALDDRGFAYRNDNTRMTIPQEDLADCDLIIETIVEDAETKAGLFRNLDAGVQKDCIFVSNSSSIKPSKLWPDSERRAQFAGFHFFFPVRFYKSVEIITTERCSAATVNALKNFAERIGKVALVLPEQGAFILNKAFIYAQAQAFHTRKENLLSYREIDDLIKKHLFAMGTFEFMDHVGLDVILAASRQYLEDMAKVTPYEGTPLTLKKQLYVKENTDKGPVLREVDGPVTVGDELVVRVELRVDRDMEYVHLKDQRGSGVEPVNVLSQYRFQDGLAYYESTRDTASHFFIDYLPKGTYVFEYSTRVVHRGQYQTGMAEIQCMYAPEFNSHSASVVLEAK